MPGLWRGTPVPRCLLLLEHSEDSHGGHVTLQHILIEEAAHTHVGAGDVRAGAARELEVPLRGHASACVEHGLHGDQRRAQEGLEDPCVQVDELALPRAERQGARDYLGDAEERLGIR